MLKEDRPMYKTEWRTDIERMFRKTITLLEYINNGGKDRGLLAVPISPLNGAIMMQCAALRAALFLYLESEVTLDEEKAANAKARKESLNAAISAFSSEDDYKHLNRAYWPLFDACGPERLAEFMNPKNRPTDTEACKDEGS